MIYSILRRRGETGRRAGLKILWTNHPCRFESDRRHQRKNNLTKTVRLFFHISAPSRLRVRWRIYEKIGRIALVRLLLSARRRNCVPSQKKRLRQIVSVFFICNKERRNSPKCNDPLFPDTPAFLPPLV